MSIDQARSSEPTVPSTQEQVILDRAGLPVDTRGLVWKLHHPGRSKSLNWDDLPITSPSIYEATMAYIRQLIKHYSVDEVSNNFRALGLLNKSNAFTRDDAAGEPISYEAVSQLRAALSEEEHWRLHYIRKWYGWCCDQGYEAFSPEVAFQLQELTIGANAKAVAVLSMDPESGPLIDSEVAALLNALRASSESGVLTLQERAALWLCVALGANPLQMVLLREEDLERLQGPDDQGALHVLKVPRMKKRDASARAQFKPRKLVAEIGDIVEQLIEHNRERRRSAGLDGVGFAAPLFSREKPRASLLGGPMHDHALAWRSPEFTTFVNAAVLKLKVISPRTGDPLWATSRRFRYTYATRLVREGASQRVVAEALDHTDLQHVQCYFDLKSDVVTSLDKATALSLGPIAQAFLGHVVRSERESTGGDRPSNRINAARAGGKIEAVGTCGSLSFCGLYAPIACYTCIKFQPWLDGPHEEVLESLLDKRKQREDSGLDGRMVAINDTTILAVADVVQRIAAVRREETSHVG